MSTAPFYALSGHRAAALYAVALAIGSCVDRRNRVGCLIRLASVATCTVADLRLAPADRTVAVVLASPGTPYLPVLACLAFITMAAAVASGRLSLLPLLAAFASSADHIGFVPTVIAVSIAVIAFGSCRIRSQPAPVLEMVGLSSMRFARALGRANRRSFLNRRRQPRGDREVLQLGERLWALVRRGARQF